MRDFFELPLYLLGLIGLRIRAHFKAARLERARARRLRRAHPEGTRGDRP